MEELRSDEVLLAIAGHAAGAISDTRARAATTASSWDELIVELDEPRSLDTATLLDQALMFNGSACVDGLGYLLQLRPESRGKHVR